jgi:RNA polymerase sigma factor (sigma-70 family)
MAGRRVNPDWPFDTDRGFNHLPRQKFMAGARSTDSTTTDPATSRLTVAEENVARRVVAAHRARLDWFLRVPEFEEMFAAGIEELGLRGGRQGISAAAALHSLPLESKHQLVRNAIGRFQHHLPRAVGQRMCTLLGLEGFNELDLEDVLSARQWRELSTRVRFRLGREHSRYKRAQNILFVGHRDLVGLVVAQTVFSARHRADCFQEGCLGLLHAIDRIDVSAASFSAFAIAWIRRHVRNFLLRERLPVYAPVNLVSRASRSLGQGAAPGDDDGSGGERTEALLLDYLRSPAVSFDDPICEGGGTVAETIADAGAESPAEAAARSDARRIVRRSLRDLTDKQREVLAGRYGLAGGADRSLSEIARAVGISHQQAGMREKRALQRLGSALDPLYAELHGPA